MNLAYEIQLQRVAQAAPALPVQSGAKKQAKGTLRAAIGTLQAGGIGSGGVSPAKKKDSKPFGVTKGIHKVLTDHGYQHGGATAEKAGGKATVNQYQHEGGKHTAKVNSETGKWAVTQHLGTAQVPDVPGGVPLVKTKTGVGAGALKEHLDYLHQTPEAGEEAPEPIQQVDKTGAPIMKPVAQQVQRQQVKDLQDKRRVK